MPNAHLLLLTRWYDFCFLQDLKLFAFIIAVCIYDFCAREVLGLLCAVPVVGLLLVDVENLTRALGEGGGLFLPAAPVPGLDAALSDSAPLIAVCFLVLSRPVMVYLARRSLRFLRYICCGCKPFWARPPTSFSMSSSSLRMWPSRVSFSSVNRWISCLSVISKRRSSFWSEIVLSIRSGSVSVYRSESSNFSIHWMIRKSILWIRVKSSETWWSRTLAHKLWRKTLGLRILLWFLF